MLPWRRRRVWGKSGGNISFKARERSLSESPWRREAQRLTDQAALAYEFPRPEHGHDGFLALLGRHHNLDLAPLDVKNGIRTLPLREYDLTPSGSPIWIDRHQWWREISWRRTGVSLLFLA